MFGANYSRLKCPVALVVSILGAVFSASPGVAAPPAGGLLPEEAQAFAAMERMDLQIHQRTEGVLQQVRRDAQNLRQRVNQEFVGAKFGTWQRCGFGDSFLIDECDPPPELVSFPQTCADAWFKGHTDELEKVNSDLETDYQSWVKKRDELKKELMDELPDDERHPRMHWVPDPRQDFTETEYAVGLQAIIILWKMYSEEMFGIKAADDPCHGLTYSTTVAGSPARIGQFDLITQSNFAATLPSFMKVMQIKCSYTQRATRFITKEDVRACSQVEQEQRDVAVRQFRELVERLGRERANLRERIRALRQYFIGNGIYLGANEELTSMVLRNEDRSYSIASWNSGMNLNVFGARGSESLVDWPSNEIGIAIQDMCSSGAENLWGVFAIEPVPIKYPDIETSPFEFTYFTSSTDKPLKEAAKALSTPEIRRGALGPPPIPARLSSRKRRSGPRKVGGFLRRGRRITLSCFWRSDEPRA
jgi:hypothetical protein